MGCCGNNQYCCVGTMRTYLIIINIFNTVLGAAVLAAACVLLAADGKCDTTCALTPGRMSVGLFAVSLYIITLGLSGIVGASLRFKNWGIILHIWLLSVLLLLHLVVVAGLVKLTDVGDLKEAITAKLENVYAVYGDQTLTTLGIDIVQGVLQCCGSAGSSDFTSGGAASHWVSNHAGYPCSCCPMFVCKEDTTSPTNLHSDGCTALLSGYTGSGLDWTAVAVSSTFALSLLSLILALVLINNRRERCCTACCWCCLSYQAVDESGVEEVALEEQ